jgi:hypothetical protein
MSKNKLLKLWIDAADDVIPCLEDWIKTTGFGAVNRRDRAALTKIEKVLMLTKERPFYVFFHKIFPNFFYDVNTEIIGTIRWLRNWWSM